MTTINRIECISDGSYESSSILVDGIRLTPEQSLKVRRHSPTGFAWGYLGSGPAQLALAILLACDVDEDDATLIHQRFKEEHISRLPQNDGWQFELDVREWADRELARREV